MFLGSQPWPGHQHNIDNTILQMLFCHTVTVDKQNKTQGTRKGAWTPARVRCTPTTNICFLFRIFQHLNQSGTFTCRRVDEFNIDWWNHVILNPSQRTKSSFVLFNLVLFVQKLLTFYKVCLPWWYDFNFYEGKIIPLSRSLCQDSNYDNGAANYQLFDPCLKQYHRGLLRKIRLRLRMRCR